MSACPVCQAAWPEPAAGAACAVCPACYSVFDRDTTGTWQLVPPFASASRALPLALGSPLDVAGHRYHLAGYAEWSYEVEHYRDMVDTLYRREFTLVSEADRSLAVLGCDDGVWWLVRERPARTIDRARYTQSRRQYYTVDRAAGLLWQCFRWTTPYQPVDHVAGPRGPGGEILLGELSANAATVWVGEFLAHDALPASLQPAAPPPPVRPHVGTASPAPVVGSPHRPGILRTLGLIAATLAILAAIAFFAYYRDRHTKPIAKLWVDCPSTKPAPRLPLPPETGRVQLDAHLTTGMISYQLRFMNPRGTVGGDTVDAVLDMNPVRRAPVHSVNPGASEMEMACQLPIPVEGRRQWLVEVRFLR